MTVNNFGELQRVREQALMAEEAEDMSRFARNEMTIEFNLPGIDEQIARLERVTELLHEIKELRDELFPRIAGTESD